MRSSRPNPERPLRRGRRQSTIIRSFKRQKHNLNGSRFVHSVGQKTDVQETDAFGSGLNWSAQHSNLVAKMECGHETATSHLLLGGQRSEIWDRWQAGEPVGWV